MAARTRVPEVVLLSGTGQPPAAQRVPPDCWLLVLYGGTYGRVEYCVYANTAALWDDPTPSWIVPGSGDEPRRGSLAWWLMDNPFRTRRTT